MVRRDLWKKKIGSEADLPAELFCKPCVLRNFHQSLPEARIPVIVMQSVTASLEALKTASVISCIRPLIAPYKIPISSILPQRRFIEKTSARDFYILCEV